jgi:hypothetical protein
MTKNLILHDYKKICTTKNLILHDLGPSLEILLKNEFLPNELYCFLVLLNLGDFTEKRIFAK